MNCPICKKHLTFVIPWYRKKSYYTQCKNHFSINVQLDFVSFAFLSFTLNKEFYSLNLNLDLYNDLNPNNPNHLEFLDKFCAKYMKLKVFT